MGAGRIRFPLLTRRLVIRPMNLADAEGLLSVYGDAETMQHLTSDLPSDLAAAEDWVRAKVELFQADDQLSLWTVLLRESGEIVGDVGLQHENYGNGRVIGLGGRGNRQFWHLGLGFEAAAAALDAGFTDLALDAVGAETGPGNLAARRLLGRLGMSLTGANPAGWPVFTITGVEWSAKRWEAPVIAALGDSLGRPPTAPSSRPS